MADYLIPITDLGDNKKYLINPQLVVSINEHSSIKNNYDLVLSGYTRLLISTENKQSIENALNKREEN
jgi:hypothetical protein